METLTTFLAMGGYAPFVWPSYALTFVVIIGLAVISVRALRSAESTLAALRGPEADSRATPADGANEA